MGTSRLVRFAARFAVCTAFVALAGCSDLITYNTQNRASGLKAYDNGDYATAAGGFRQALKEDPRDYQSHYWLGMTNLQMRNYQQAIVAFRACLDTRTVTLLGKEDDATRLKALEGLAQAIVKSDDADVEVNKVETTARNTTGPRAAQEFFVLAKIYRYRMLPDMAIDYYNRACLNDNKSFAYLKEYGLYLEQLQQNEKAEQTLRQAYAINASDAEVAAALQRLGVVPGLSLVPKEDLARPAIPKGPIPVVDVEGAVKSSLGIKGNNQPAQPSAPAHGTSIIPRD